MLTTTSQTVEHIADRYRVALDGPGPVRLNVGRDGLPALALALGLQRGAEVGVWKGEYSKRFCAAGFIWLAIDPWAPYVAFEPETKNNAALLESAFREAQQRLSIYPGCAIVRKKSLEAAKDVRDGSLDLVYIDGNHSETYVRQDLEAWAPKVRRGGIVAGHDYRVNAAKPFIQVKAAVDEYVREHDIGPLFLMAADRSPSFFWVVA